MRQINLLPWRESRRKQRQREFGIVAGASILVAALVVLGVHLFYASGIEYQEARNKYLRGQIAQQRKVERDIKAMEKTKAQILGRMEVIENLQASRPEMVYVFDELVRVLPEDVFLTSMGRSGGTVSLKGVARSNNHVSDFMRHLESSQWFAAPNLSEVNNDELGEVRASFFQLKVRKQTPKAADEREAEEAAS